MGVASLAEHTRNFQRLCPPHKSTGGREPAYYFAKHSREQSVIHCLIATWWRDWKLKLELCVELWVNDLWLLLRGNVLCGLMLCGWTTLCLLLYAQCQMWDVITLDATLHFAFCYYALCKIVHFVVSGGTFHLACCKCYFALCFVALW